MTDHPALFQPDMVTEIIEGRKTQTRRTERAWARLKPGDRIYVRERHWRFGRWERTGKRTPSGKRQMTFTPNHGVEPVYTAPAAVGVYRDSPSSAWWPRPGMFHERQHSRITLIVTARREEWLHVITDEDALAEGVTPVSGVMPPRLAFETLWRRINGDASWEKNPLVSVTTFRPMIGNIDSIIDEAAPVSERTWKEAEK